MKNKIPKGLMEFRRMYITKIAPELRYYEKERKKLLAKFVASTVFMVALPFVFFLLLYSYTLFDFIMYGDTADDLTMVFMLLSSFLLLFFAAGAGFCLFKKKYAGKFVKIIKDKVFKDFVKIAGDINWVQHDAEDFDGNNEKLKSKNLERSGLFLNFDKRKSDDEFFGCHKGVPFVICETELYDIIRHKGRECYQSIFTGLVIAFKSSKKIKNRTIVSTKGDFTKKNQILYSVLISLVSCVEFFKDGYSHFSLALVIIIAVITFFVSAKVQSKEEKLETVNLEDPEFAKRFTVNSSDQVEARYLVTTAFMERFYNLQTAFGTKNIKCSFCGDTLMIAISSKKNLFEIGDLFKPLNCPSCVDNLYYELKSIFKMIEYVKLNEKTALEK